MSWGFLFIFENYQYFYVFFIENFIFSPFVL
jgi:hypothetical protein